ncbi:unnamed protein product [Rhizoctonia solani]|uniref:F-box domain-containing protein n=1 Tax=Rhizoctonia solani TaxID=456999 RepID=A0A8H3H567_9AGAM|nr:unnamed protein product [Rhizoctonia solani]
MIKTRSSARLASVKGKEVKRIEGKYYEEVDDPMSEEVSVKAESEYQGSGDEEPQSRLPPHKRQKTLLKPDKGQPQPRKKHVRGKQGGLAGLVNMPIDIFTEIASHLLPIDIISLSRANRFFRNLLMNRSSSHIWHGVMRNVRGLPPCPPDLSEPHFLALLFSKHCTMCGQPLRCRMDEILRVRLCVLCREEHLVSLENIPWELRSLVHHSGRVVPSKRRWGPDVAHALKEEVRQVEQRYQELGNGGNGEATMNWEAERRDLIAKRTIEANAIKEFLDTIENDREQELREMKHGRRREIENRLVKLGWEKKDMQFTFHSPSRKEWYYLVEQAKPLTERIWTNLQPKLIPILEANREARLQKEISERQSSRRVRLVNLMTEIKKSQPPILDISVRAPTNQRSPPSSSGSGNGSQKAGSSGGVAEAQSSGHAHATPASSSATGVAELIQTTFRGIFPDIVDALEWLVVKTLHETDSSVNQMEQNFVECRSEIDTAIADWKVATHSRLAEMLRRDEDIEESLTPRLIVQKDDSDPFANLSDDLKLLLRADSLFTTPPPRIGAKTAIYSYDTAVTQFGYKLTFRDGMMSRAYKPPLDFSRIHVCSEARHIARTLLVDMGLEGASVAELKGVGRGYACARCPDSGLKNWEELVAHFVEAKEVFARVQEHPDQLEALKITYRDMHDPEEFPDRPLVKHTSEPNVNSFRGCMICPNDPIMHVVRGSEAKIIEHLEDVHDITEPKIGTHYSNSGHPYPFGGFDPVFDFSFDTELFFTHFGESDSDMDPFWDTDLW